MQGAGGVGGFRVGGGQGGLQLGGGQSAGGLQLGGGQGAGGGLQLGGGQSAGGLQLGGGQSAGGLQLGGQPNMSGGSLGFSLGGLNTGQGGLQLGGGQGASGLQLGGQPNTMAGGTSQGLSLGGLNTGGGLQLGGGQGAGGGLQLGGGQGAGGGLQLGGGQGAGGGLRLGQTGLQQQATGGLQLGQPQVSGGLQLGQPQVSGGLQLGQPQVSGGLQLGQMLSGGGRQQTLGQIASTGGLQSGQARGLPPPAYTTATAPGLQLTNQTASPGGLQLGTPKLGGGLQLGGLSTQTPKTGGPQPGLQLGGQRAGGGLQLGGLGVAKPAPTSGGVAGALPSYTPLSKPISLGTPSTVGGLKVGPSLKTSTVSTATTGAPPSYTTQPAQKYTYKELESLINKWTLELQGQEELFLKQATQVNKWDRTLSENGDKIVELHGEVDRVKTEQERVTNELEMIEGQQSELDQLLTSLESRIEHAPKHTGHHADMQRNRTFTMAENVDSQLKQMSSDLKMIIEQMNKSNTSSDDDNPFTQIVSILNAHTDSLGWIDHEAALLRKKVDDVAKVTDYHRREQEHSFRKLAFSHQ